MIFSKGERAGEVGAPLSSLPAFDERMFDDEREDSGDGEEREDDWRSGEGEEEPLGEDEGELSELTGGAAGGLDDWLENCERGGADGWTERLFSSEGGRSAAFDMGAAPAPSS